VLEVEESYLDWTVRCPHCGEEFVPDAGVAPAPRPRPRRAEPRDDDRDGDPRYGAGYPGRSRAREIVAGPATALEIAGWIGVLLSIGACLLCVALAVEAGNANRNGNNANNGDDEDEVVLLIMGGCAGVLGLPYSVAMALGARKMRDLTSRGWALTACILAVASFALFGVCGVIQAGIGVWALVALENPAVRAAFAAGRRRYREWDD
jgi:hypothetical protein